MPSEPVLPNDTCLPTNWTSATRNPRQAPEESGPFGRNRSLRSTISRGSRTRTGTTPIRQQENPTVAGFGRLFAKEQAKEEAERNKRTGGTSTTTNTEDAPRIAPPEAVATECSIWGYANKSSEWKVISRFERIVAPSIICEDYPREDPNLFLSSTSPFGFSKAAVVVHRHLSQDALKKSRVYRGGQHWIKVTFESYQAAQKACSYSPVEIDGHLVYCGMWEGKPPFTDQPILKGQDSPRRQHNTNSQIRSLTTSQSAGYLSGKDSAVAGFERAIQTLPRSHTMPPGQFTQPQSQDDSSITSTTASSATATATDTPTSPIAFGLRSRSTPHLPTQITSPNSDRMALNPAVKKVVLRPISEALPPQPTFSQRVLRSIPVLNWLLGSKDTSGDIIGEGPALKEDGSWDPEKNGWYWNFWYGVDGWLGSDFCGIKDD